MSQPIDLPRAQAALTELDRLAREHPELIKGDGECWSDNINELETVLMVTPGKSRQAAYRERMKERGYRQFTLWLDTATADLLYELAEKRSEESMNDRYAGAIQEALKLLASGN